MSTLPMISDETCDQYQLSMTINVLSIMRGTTVDGPGFRTSIYMAGCNHGCPGCHNPQSWDFKGGEPMTLDEIMEIVNEEDFDVTLSGGDPLCSPTETLALVKALKISGRNVWVYTGYTWEEIMARKELLEIVKLTEVVVEGPFVEALKDPDLLFRGSANQRLVDVKRTLASGVIELYS